MLFVPDPAVEAEISRLEELPLNRLRILWRERLGAVPNTRVPTSCVGAWRTSCRSARMAACDQMFANALANFIRRSRPTQTTPRKRAKGSSPAPSLRENGRALLIRLAFWKTASNIPESTISRSRRSLSALPARNGRGPRSSACEGLAGNAAVAPMRGLHAQVFGRGT
jgi:hypothetical protein